MPLDPCRCCGAERRNDLFGKRCEDCWAWGVRFSAMTNTMPRDEARKLYLPVGVKPGKCSPRMHGRVLRKSTPLS